MVASEAASGSSEAARDAPLEHVRVDHRPEAPHSPVGDDSPPVDFERTLSRRRKSSKRNRPTANSAIQDVLEETEARTGKFLGHVAQKAIILWREVAQPLWLPLLGLATLGSAFTVPTWLAILDILVGIVLVHIRAWQDWVQITCLWGGRSCQLNRVEQGFAVTAVVLGLAALLYRVVFSGAGHFAAFDLFYVGFSLGGAGSAWCKPPMAGVPHMREVPGVPVLLLFLAIATLAPAPGLASLPYALLFLALLARLVTRCNLGSLAFGSRLCLLFMTTSHISALLVLSFWGPGAPMGFVDCFGFVGRAMTTIQNSQPFCTGSFMETSELDKCKPGSASVFWPGVHVTALLLLHFVLTNITCSQWPETRKTPPPADATVTGRDVVGAKAWVKIAVRWIIFANLVVFVVGFPSLMSMPLLLMSFSLTVDRDGLCRGIFRFFFRLCSPVTRCLGRLFCCRCCCCKRSPDLGQHQAVHWKGRYVCCYMAFIFLIKYIFNIAQGDLPGRPGVSLWLNQTLHLQNSVPVANARRTWFQCIGLEYYGAMGVSHAAGAFFPQSVILLFVVSLQVILDDPEAPRHRYAQFFGRVLERLWFLIYSVNKPEVSMVAALSLIMFMFECEDGRASVFTVSYMVVLVAIMLCRRLLRQKLWLLLQCLAEFGSVVLVLTYVSTSPSLVLPYPVSNFVTVACGKLPAIVAPHLGIALCAGLQRLCLQEAARRPRALTGESVGSDEEQHNMEEEQRGSTQALMFCFKLDVKAVRTLKLFFEEMIVLGVMILSLVTTLLPPVDVHSLLLLAVVGPALLIYNLEDDRERLLLRVLKVLHLMTAFFLLSRTVFASPLVPLPRDEDWPMNLQELGMNRPAGDTTKLLFLGFVTVLCRVAMKEARMAIREISDMEKELALDSQLSMRSLPKPFPGVAPAAGAPEADVSAGAVTFTMSDGPAEDMNPSQHADLMSLPHGDGLDALEGDEDVRPTHQPGFFKVARKGSATFGRQDSSVSALKKKSRRDRRFKRGRRWEEKLLMKWVPGWMPLKPHAYFSALLLIASFAVSITEVHVLNFLMILAVVSLCGWYELWVQAGNVFSFTTVVIMLLQYLGRFHVWDSLIQESYKKVIGLQWSSNQVVRHCSILVLCFLQKQLWHRGRYSKPRPPLCPRWLSRHADLVGMAALLLVAVARRHFLSPLLAAAALPWLVREEWEDLTANISWFANPAERMTRSWLRFFRLILLLTLLGQVSMRLVVEFEFQDRFDVFFSWSCSMWQNDVSFVSGAGNATSPIAGAVRAECIQEWRSYMSMVRHSGGELLWEFLALFFLGMVQQLFERVETEEAAESQSSRWKLVAMHWWPCCVFFLTFVLSLEGGNILGIIFLLLLIGVAFSSNSVLARRRRWVWRTQLCAWVFLFLGLGLQSPVLPCGRASCDGQVHRTFVAQDKCVQMQNFNITNVESEKRTNQCGQMADALGHDTYATLMIQVGGLRRIGGTNFWESIGVLVGSQLGVLLHLILVASIQVRIYNSAIYRERVDEQFISEPRSFYIERARRYVHEFHCRCRLEEMASRERRRALRDKLKRGMKEINQILSGGAVRGSVMEEARHDILVEELQLSHGVKKEVAREVTQMYDKDMSLSKQYLNVLHLVTLGRMQPDSVFLHKQFERLRQASVHARVMKAPQKVLQTIKTTFREHHEEDILAARSQSNTSLTQNPRGAALTQLRRFKAWSRAQWNLFQKHWTHVKQGVFLTRCMYDYAFVGTDEVRFCLRPASGIATEELDEHRRENGPIRLLWKVALSNMASLVAVASVLAFVETRSILDLVRTFAVFFVAVSHYPFPPTKFWKALLAYSVVLLVLRTVYDLPIFCAGPSLRAAGGSLSWEPDNTVMWCPAVTVISLDITFGIAKRRGASALEQQSWFWAVWADHLCIWTVLLHKWMLIKSGLWDHVAYDKESKQVWLVGGTEVFEATEPTPLRPTGSAGDDSTVELPRAYRPSRQGHRSVRAPNDVEGMTVQHQTQVMACMKIRDRFLAEYYEQLTRESARLTQAGGASGSEFSVRDSASDLPSDGVPHSASGLGLGQHGGGAILNRVSRATAHLKGRMPLWMHRGDHHGTHSIHLEESRLEMFLCEGTDLEIEDKVRALITIQKASKKFLDRRRKHKRIRCLMGHPLQKDVAMVGARPPVEVCDRCNLKTTIRYSCKECDYHACNDCVQRLLALDQGMGKQDGVAVRTFVRPGISVYWLKYLLGLVLLTYFLLFNTAIFTSEARSTLEAVQANNISAQTLLLLTVHLTLLISDRIFHKWHYRSVGHGASLKIIEALNLICLLSEFFWVHVTIILQLRSAPNPREQRLALSSEVALCMYYLLWMVYLGVCLTQRKYGLPAVDHDTLRPTAPPDAMGIYIEKIHTFSWYFHYALPFVDDLRVIIDWSVMPTSLDLWMHFKVEDAHSWLFRTRHTMYVRRQSFFAEPRDACEKVYSGWLIVLLLVFIILMPLLVFSPITPFPNSVPIQDGQARFSLGVATACVDRPLSRACRMEKIPLYQAAATQILTYNSSKKETYLTMNPRVPTDIDIQEVLWPLDSRSPLEVSPPVGREVQALLNAQAELGLPVAAFFELTLDLARENNMPSFMTRHVVCFCAPSGSCETSAWPSAVNKACRSEPGVTPDNWRMAQLNSWWHALGRGSEPQVESLGDFWESKVRVGTDTPILQGPAFDVLFSLANCTANCPAGWCGQAHCWGRLEPVGDARGHSDATVIYELERSAMLNPLSTSTTSFSVVGLYIAVVLVAGRYLRAAFQDSSKRSIYEEIPDVGAFLDLVTAIKLAREHRDLNTEFQLYYCLMKVLRSTNLLITTGGHEPVRYGAGRHDEPPPECLEPRLAPHRYVDADRRDTPSWEQPRMDTEGITGQHTRTFTL